MLATGTQALHTVEDLEQLSQQGLRYELIQGGLHEMSPTGGPHGSATSRLSYYVNAHVYAGDLGETFAAETGFLVQRHPDTVLAPDFAFVAAARLPRPLPLGFVPIVPDLVVETRSPGDTPRASAAKVTRWLDFGARLVWEINPAAQCVTVSLPGSTLTVLGVEDVLNGDPVLPGFELLIRRLFPWDKSQV